MSYFNLKPDYLPARIRHGMSFLEWLSYNYKTTPEDLERTVLTTGTHKEYVKCLEWYQARYRMELKQLNELQQITIKQYLEEKNHDGNEITS